VVGFNADNCGELFVGLELWWDYEWSKKGTDGHEIPFVVSDTGVRKLCFNCLEEGNGLF